ncbi:FtsK/SpoIIIE domain-containing protein [Paenibacillus xylaniclasticus]|uniref:FtsK/SpoIIIE domain-containing protein n=1 Tax=Paenibacillus xylaniclasticus TaxID=588083 RepID=UPI000FD87764|nr:MULTISPECIES: FtsK/SpoIIIE domain-containing protein [Paenibacillus]GFN32578.1 hypothetical protein PCURB6_28380 [Paenibacillus curdlanolyticus]
MILNQLLPKGKKIPEMSYYELKGLSFNYVKSYLNNLIVADRILGIEVVATENSMNSYFFIESHKTDLNLNPTKINDDPAGWAYDYYSINSVKSSIFPFRTIESPLWMNLNDLSDKEQIVIQLLFMKIPQERVLDMLWSQYEDYVNGIEYPTTNFLIRSIQQSILEIMYKIEGGYRKHERIPETEQKLSEGIFSFEARLLIAAENENRNKVLLDKIKDVFQQHNFINSWSFVKENDKSFIKHMRLRRFSLLRKKQYLSSSEIAGFFLTENLADTKSSILTTVEHAPVIISKSAEENSSPFTIFPCGEKQNRENDYKIAGLINKALRKLNLISDEDVIVQKIQHGATVKRITFTLPVGLKLTTLQRAVNDIQTELALTSIGITQGSNAGTAVLSIPQIEREFVLVRDCVEDEAFKRFAKSATLPLLIGQSETGEVVFTDLVNIKHLLIAGSTGSGKSVCLNSMLTVLLTLVSPNDLKVFMIDPKMVELASYAKYPHVQQVFTDMNDIDGVLCFLCEKMDERYAKFKEKSYKNIQQYNRNEANKMPYIVLVIDEMADLIMQCEDTENHIVRLAQKSRAAGIHIITATQRPQKEVITGLIKANIYSRICFACDSGFSYRIALDETPPFELLGKGDGVYRFEGVQGLHRFQGALIAKTEEEQDYIIDKMSYYWKVKPNKELIDIESSRKKKDERELNEFKKLVLESGETRITELQKIMSVRNEKVKKLMTQLINIGWIKQHKSRAKGYELLLNDVERKRELERLR